MRRETVLQILNAHKQALYDRYGVTRLSIFGSVARDQATDTSDVDVVVEMPPDLFQMVHMKEDLEEMLAAPVDLVRYNKYLDDYMKRRIYNEAVFD